MINLQKDFPLTSRVGHGCINQSSDIVLVQMSLSLLKRPNGQSYYTGRIDGGCGAKLLEAIDLFFADQGLAAPNAFQPQSMAHQRLASLVKDRLARLPRSLAPYLTFNGKRLCWIGKPHNGKCWDAVSGVQGFQAAEHQSVPDKGPIPEGTWRVRQDKYQEFRDVPLLNQIGSYFSDVIEPFRGQPTGAWPNGVFAWGSKRIWLEPKQVRELHGRSGFSIHGGISSGSAGCLDLTKHMTDFGNKFVAYGADMELIVKYDLF